jgi:pimeloyl-ACP methyl ester carboxylesterase
MRKSSFIVVITMSFDVGRSSFNLGVFKDKEMDWVFKRTLEFMNEKAAEIAECLYAARRIEEEDGESWIREWSSLAAMVDQLGDESLSKGHKVSARESFMRASNYYRTAEYGASPNHPRFDELWEKSVNSFHKACPLFNPSIEILSVSFENKELPAYFWRPDNTDKKRPTLMVAGGNDSSLEELVFFSGRAAVRRGYNFFTFDHPGHRGAVHKYSDCVKRHDYEVPYKDALDLLEKLPGVNERIALTGYSFGGYIAVRVATHEKRIKAIVPNPPQIDSGASESFWGGFASKVPTWLINWAINRKLGKKPISKSMLDYTMWSLGYGQMPLGELLKDEKFLEQARSMKKDWDIKDDLYKITCPTLALVGGGEGEVFEQQATEFLSRISSTEKKLHIFTLESDGSNDHCQLDNRSRGNQVMFDWLDGIFNYRYDRAGD